MHLVCVAQGEYAHQRMIRVWRQSVCVCVCVWHGLCEVGKSRSQATDNLKAMCKVRNLFWDRESPKCFFFFLINLFILFIYFWLRWVFVAARGLSLIAASRG